MLSFLKTYLSQSRSRASTSSYWTPSHEIEEKLSDMDKPSSLASTHGEGDAMEDQQEQD